MSNTVEQRLPVLNKPPLSIYLLIIASIIVLFGIYLFNSSGILLSSVLIGSSCIIFVITPLIVFFRDQDHSKYSLYSSTIFILIYIFLFISIINGISNYGLYGNGGFFIFDVSYFGLLACGLLFIGLSRAQLSKFIFYFSIAIFSILLISVYFGDLYFYENIMALDRSRIMHFTNIFDRTILLTTPSLCIYLSILLIISKNNKVIYLMISLIAAIYFFSGLYFSKRNVLFEFFILFTTVYIPLMRLSLINTKHSHVLTTVLLLASFLIYFSLFNEVGMILIDRLLQRVDFDLSGIDRVIEAQIFLSSLDISSLIIGLGAGSYHYISGFAVNHLHIGLANLIFKEGVIFFMIIIFTIFKNIYLSFNYNNDKRLFIIAINTNAFFILLHSPLWGWNPNTLLLSCALFSVDIVKALRE